MNTDTNTQVIDADAHVVECAHTWDFMDPSDRQYRPISLETREEAGVRLQFWVIDGKVRGFRGRSAVNLPTSRRRANWATSIYGSNTWIRSVSMCKCCTTPCLSNRPPIAPRWKWRCARAGIAGSPTSGSKGKDGC